MGADKRVQLNPGRHVLAPGDMAVVIAGSRNDARRALLTLEYSPPPAHLMADVAADQARYGVRVAYLALFSSITDAFGGGRLGLLWNALRLPCLVPKYCFCF